MFTITSVEFQNFRSLRNTVLPLQRCTLIVGPNGSGKSTALKGLQLLGNPGQTRYQDIVSLGFPLAETVRITVNFSSQLVDSCPPYQVQWNGNSLSAGFRQRPDMEIINHPLSPGIEYLLHNIAVFSFNPKKIAAQGKLSKYAYLEEDGANLVVVLDRLRDSHPERFTALNQALNHWMPEFDHILFETLDTGDRALRLRTTIGKHSLAASDLSDGTLFVLAILTIAYLPAPPKVICLEEPERGIHPRLLRDVQEALYRLSYPENFGEDREPVQVIATTHSPYLLDLFRDHPEQVVLANKSSDGASFEQLSAQPNIEEILRDSQLGEVWYTGILGGVPAYA